MAESINTTSYALDASFVLSFLLPDEHIQKVDEIFRRFIEGGITLYAPALLPFEVLNGLTIAVSRKRLKKDQARDLGKTFLQWDIRYEVLPLDSVFELAMDKNLTVYDASYVVLAAKQRIPLLTLDKSIAKI